MGKSNFVCGRCYRKLDTVCAYSTMKLNDDGAVEITETSFVIMPCSCTALDDETIGDAIDAAEQAGNMAIGDWSDYEYARDCDDLILRLKEYKKDKNHE